MKRQFQTFNFLITNAADDAVDIYIDGQIVDAETQQIYRDWFGDDTSVSFKSFRNQLNAVQARTYNVYINSPGGLVTDAMAIHDLLIDLQGKGKTVNTIGRGIIASAATYILMAGKNAEMSANSWFMIHNVSGFAWGDVNEVENMAATLRKFNDAARDFYANATGLRKEEITKMMNAETWMTADEAKTKGFIKQISNEAKFSNTINPEHWQFSNKAVLNAYNSAVKTPPQSEQLNSSNQFAEMKKFFENLGAQIMNAIKGVKAPENNDHATLMEGIAEAVSTSISNAGEQMETSVNEVVTNELNKVLNEAVTKAVNEVVKPHENRIAQLETAKGDLENKNAELEKEITNLKGKPTNTGNGGNGGPAPVGGFNSK